MMEQTTGKHAAWLSALKAGDEVAIAIGGRWNPRGYRYVKVERTTKTQIILEGGDRFTKSRGGSVGADYYGSPRIEQPTPELRAQADMLHRHEAALSAAHRMPHFHKMTTAQLEAVTAAYASVKETEQ